MNLSQLEAFAETCQLGSYTRAAEHLYISQPALHHKVKQLEAELGMPLLVVRDRRVIPTTEGELVLSVAERVLGEVRGLEEHFRLMAEQHSVRVGATSLLAATALSASVAAFRAERPDVDVHIVSLDPDELYETLLANRVDFAVAYREYVTPDFEVETLLESEVICVASHGHPLVDGKVHRPEELLAYPIALTEKGMGMRTKVEGWFRNVAGVTDLPVAFEARTGALLAQAAASSNEYVTFLTKTALTQFNLAQILIDGPTIPSVAVLCHLPGQRHRRVVKQFLNTLRLWAGSQRMPPAAVRRGGDAAPRRRLEPGAGSHGAMSGSRPATR